VRITLLGTGAAGGVPLYGCTCPACDHARADKRLARRPCSALVESGGARVLVDAGLMDLHERFPPGSLAAVVLTHYHPDHVQGLFHLRWGMGEVIPVYGPPDPQGCADLYRNRGLLDFRMLDTFEPLFLGPLKFTPLPLIHSKPTFGYAIEGAAGERFAYLTDTCGLPARTEAFLLGWGNFDLALDCTFPPGVKPDNHNDWTSALASAATLGARRTWLTHIGHRLDAWRLATSTGAPPGVEIGQDDAAFDVAPASQHAGV
jgi:phosphoribosyl 1,2-cyclic phosphate phosphodiesterase